MMKNAIIYLEDGAAFYGQSLDVSGESSGEIVFNTAMSGYQEVLTDPSYAGQIVLMTYPLIGNYGVNEEDAESDRVHVQGFIVKEFCRHHSNYRATASLISYLNQNKIIAIEGVDTRALTRHLRQRGAMRAILSTEDLSLESLAQKMRGVPFMEGADWVSQVTTPKPYIWPAEGRYKDPARLRVAVVDCGVKRNILRIFAAAGCECHIFPAETPLEKILTAKPDGLFLSNGPGDPATAVTVIQTAKEAIGRLPVFGICLGHQILGLAMGGKTYKLKFGHHGVNHPVMDCRTGRVGITSQNHGFCVDIDSIDPSVVEAFQINLNDQTVEGIRHRKYPVFGIQHHPEAAPGPHDVQYLFTDFIEAMGKNKANA